MLSDVTSSKTSPIKAKEVLRKMRATMKSKAQQNRIVINTNEEIDAMTSYYSCKKDIETKKIRIEKRKLELIKLESNEKFTSIKFDKMKKISDFNFEQLKKRIELKNLNSNYSDEQLESLFPLKEEDDL